MRIWIIFLLIIFFGALLLQWPTEDERNQQPATPAYVPSDMSSP